MNLLFDEHIDRDVLTGLQRKSVKATIVMAVDVGLQGKTDPELLAWAAQHNYLVLTKDKSTIDTFAYQRMQDGLAMPGVILITRELSTGQIIESLFMVVECCTADEFKNRVFTIPV
jgi:predicted nuclease of predicted toxin-antitoxin system